MMVPRKQKESTVSAEEHGTGIRGWLFPEVLSCLRFRSSTEIQVILTAPGHQMVSLQYLEVTGGVAV